MKGGWVYIITNQPNGILYTAVTSGLVKRVWEHRVGVVDGFTKDCGLRRLVYFEFHDDIISPIQREKTIKHWSRAWNVNLIVAGHPDWDDLSGEIV
jgi:putative endonuclease